MLNENENENERRLGLGGLKDQETIYCMIPFMLNIKKGGANL